jgi:histidinol-phosphate aminotransferase
MSTVRRDVGQLFRRDLDQLEAYPAPQPLEDFAADVGVDPADVVKLDQNENPYGCSPLVRERLGSFQWHHVYPDPDHRVLRRRLAHYAGVDESSLVLGNGSDELIELLLRLVVEPGERVVVPAPSFGFYENAARVAGANYITVRRGPAFEVNPAAIAAAVDERTKLVFLASPNNPTGNLTPLGVIRQLLHLDALVVVDEAYFEFSGQTAVSILQEERPDNLIVLRTFSKWAGLAGLRLGYGIMPARVVAGLDRIRPPYSINQAAEVAGLASLDDLDHLRSTIERILLERERLATALAGTGLFRLYPSDANFLLGDVINQSAAEVQRHLAARAILVRRYSSPRLENCLRITVGKPEHTDRLIAALHELLS